MAIKNNKLVQVSNDTFAGEFGPTQARSGYCYVTAVFNFGPTDDKSEVFFKLGFDEGCNVVIGTLGDVVDYIDQTQVNLDGEDEREYAQTYCTMMEEVQAAYFKFFGGTHIPLGERDIDLV